ncbi:MFS transporter [Amycolatopsis sp. PS_44_ISF1]|uniref:MFS transporter n=1 Tax=Amycolatopsis sp. PS_44_ISF1 TaxID=2974917 RepID=UPI0028DD451D|nr:MFS transporter [Amycolatopsis sp. PS_44_ISF1]MDT8912927.1 MFS transporter [Amycolatopsis sp. PS_44_ISF1]
MTATREPEITPLRKNRDFLLLWSGSAVSVLGSTASTVAYPLLVLATTGSAADAGVVGFVALLPMLLLQIPASALVDRWDRRTVMIWCDAIRAAALTTIVLALAVNRLYLPHILVVGFVEGTVSVTHELAAGAAVPHVVHKSQVSAALSRNEARERGATMLGTPLGGILFGLGRAVPFVLDALTYVVSLVTLLFIRRDFQTGKPEHEERHVLDGIRWLWRNEFLRTATFLIAGSNLLFRAMFLIVVVMAGDLGASPAWIGVLFGVAGGAGLLGSLAADRCRRRFDLATIVIGANWLWAVLMVVIVATGNVYALGAAYAGMWFVGPLWNVAVTSHQLEITPDHLQGRVLGAVGVLAFGAVPLGSLIGGYTLDRLGSDAAALVFTGWMVLLATAATLSRSVRQTRRHNRVPHDAQVQDPPGDGDPGRPALRGVADDR